MPRGHPDIRKKISLWTLAPPKGGVKVPETYPRPGTPQPRPVPKVLLSKPSLGQKCFDCLVRDGLLLVLLFLISILAMFLIYYCNPELPDQCRDYVNLTDPGRNSASKNISFRCDTSNLTDVLERSPDFVGHGWYRFNGESGTEMAFREQVNFTVCIQKGTLHNRERLEHYQVRIFQIVALNEGGHPRVCFAMSKSKKVRL